MATHPVAMAQVYAREQRLPDREPITPAVASERRVRCGREQRRLALSRRIPHGGPRRSVAAVFLLATVMLWLPACAQLEHAAVALQFVRSGKRSIENDGGGLGVFVLPAEDSAIGGFIEAHLSWSGNVRGPRYEDVPLTSVDDPVVDRQVTAGTLHFGPMVQVTHWLHAYAGLGVGNRYVQEQRFDDSFVLADDGNYRRPGRDHYRGSGSAGLLLQPDNRWMLGIGYDVFFDGVVISLGFAW